MGKMYKSSRSVIRIKNYGLRRLKDKGVLKSTVRIKGTNVEGRRS